jgi:hypothetical protein
MGRLSDVGLTARPGFPRLHRTIGAHCSSGCRLDFRASLSCPYGSHLKAQRVAVVRCQRSALERLVRDKIWRQVRCGRDGIRGEHRVYELSTIFQICGALEPTLVDS